MFILTKVRLTKSGNHVDHYRAVEDFSHAMELYDEWKNDENTHTANLSLCFESTDYDSFTNAEMEVAQFRRDLAEKERRIAQGLESAPAYTSSEGYKNVVRDKILEESLKWEMFYQNTGHGWRVVPNSRMAHMMTLNLFEICLLNDDHESESVLEDWDDFDKEGTYGILV